VGERALVFPAPSPQLDDCAAERVDRLAGMSFDSLAANLAD
jgi:hypothetical protein